ncbi:MAG: right-handed parallel beta-helix repeat-containing protein [Luminiphilus sp.]
MTKIVAGTTISSDQTWSGEILVTGPIYVPEGVTLRIEPGTRIEFAAIESYRDDQIGMELDGRLLAEGTASQPIWFTSAAATPRNGDWGMLRLNGATGSTIEYAIVEFAQQGINLWGSDVTIANSVVRWNNWEGIYLENHATASIRDTLIYQNGYNGIAMEQFNDATVTGSIIENNGSHGIHIDASTALLEENLVRGNGFSGISLDNNATLTARDNRSTNNGDLGFAFGEGQFSLTLSGNDASGNPEGSGLSAVQQSANGGARGPGELADVRALDLRPYELGYTPSDPQRDTYPYVFPDDSERSIELRHGEGLGLTWSLAVAGDTLWTSTLSGDIYQLDAESGQILKTLKAPSVQPWGMTHDGQHLWITDFAEKRTYRLDTDSGQELFSFANPSQQAGAKGLAWDGSHLYIMGWEDQTIYKTTTQGQLVATINLQGDGGGGLAWDGSSFWVPAGKKLLQYSPSGELLDEIYGGSEGNWDLSWDPARELLWASQRTNENWFDDGRIFGLRVYEQVAGSTGIDSRPFRGTRDEYSLKTVDGALLVSDSVAGRDGAQSLSDIERLHFADGGLALDLDASQNAGKTALFFGAVAYDRLTDKSAFGTILHFVDNGYSDLTSLSQFAIDAGVIRDLAGGESDEALARLVSRNILGEEPQAVIDLLVDFMDGTQASFSHAQFLATVAALDVNQERVDLVGIAQTGMEYVPVGA